MKNYNSKEWLKENGISDDSISVKHRGGYFALSLSKILDKYSKIDMVETNDCLVDDIKYTKEEVLCLVKDKLIEAFGKPTSHGYFVMGVINDSLHKKI